MNTTVEIILSKYENKISELGLQLREFILSNLKNISEQPDAAANIIGYNFGTGYKDLICTIMPSKRGLKLGFYKGSELPDPQKLLTGSGKVHKFVEIKSAHDISSPALKRLLTEAVNAWRARNA